MSQKTENTGQKTALIIGAGPAGLTAALEFLRRTDIRPIVLESSQEIGGISRTVQYKGNRMDIGGHRFFSKSDRIMDWWLDIMPAVDNGNSGSAIPISYQNKQRDINPSGAQLDPEKDDLVMLVRPRRSRIYFMRRFFDYPIKLTADTLAKLGPIRSGKIGLSYIAARVNQITPETSLETFIINRFGKELYSLFFESYTEKVWGVPPKEISAEWGKQRIKGLSLTSAIKHFLKQSFASKNGSRGDLKQKSTDTSLIERFLYPKLGPGQLWEHVASLVQKGGGEIHLGMRATKMKIDGNRITEVQAQGADGQVSTFEPNYVISTMPITHLIEAMDAPIPKNVQEVTSGLVYRDFITVGILVNKLLVTEPDGSLLKDTWIYIQEPDVKIGRLQIFNNWSPWMVADKTKVWIGLEYFCNDTDELWKMSDEAMRDFGVSELAKIGILDPEDVVDGHVVRVPKTYPAYFGTYDRFDVIRDFLDKFENLFLVGRNGMHKYNNQDHSMLTAITAVENIAKGSVEKANLWEINTEQEYHEKKSESTASK